MPDVFIGLKEAAAFEGISYDTIKKRVQRNPQQYKTKMQPSEAGGREQVLVSVDSLTAKGRKAWRAYNSKSYGMIPSVYIEKVVYNEEQHMLRFSVLYISCEDDVRHYIKSKKRDEQLNITTDKVYDDEV